MTTVSDAAANAYGDRVERVTPGGSGRIQIVTGADAVARVADAAFASAWQALWDACPWATGFQSHAFAAAWYGAYEREATPCLVWREGRDGTLSGLFALAYVEGGARLAAVGAHQAEYHAWLAPAGDGDAFILGALDVLRASGRVHTLDFLYLPPGAPVAWASAPRGAFVGAHLRPHDRGLMSVEGDEIARSLKKSGNRSKLNRLQKLGALRFERLASRDELAAVLDELSVQCDLRHGAVHGSTPFRSDPRKAEFQLRMMERSDLLHASVLRVGDQLAAAHLGVVTRHANRREVALGIISHSPFLAAHSPGKLLLLLLGELLQREGFTALDLTPGGEYKERFATHHDTAHHLAVYFTPAAWARAEVRRRAREIAKTAAARVVRDPARIRATVGRARTLATALLRPAGFARRVAHRARAVIGARSESRFYRMSAAEAAALPEESTLQRDNIADLLRYVQVGPTDRTPGEFLRDALARLEGGQHVYTLVEGGILLHYSWLIKRQAQSASEWGQPYALAEGASVLFDDYTHPAARGRGLHSASLRQRARDAAALPGADWVYISVLAENTPSRRNIERAGFVHCKSFYRETRLGRTRLS